MKNIKRFAALFLAVVMAVMTIGSTTAFAAENIASQQDDFYIVHDFDIVLSNATPSAPGNPFVATRNYLWFDVKFTPTNGSVILSVKLHDNTTGEVREWQSSNGTVSQTVPVTPGHSYIFEYLRAYGSQNINLHNNGYSVNG